MIEGLISFLHVAPLVVIFALMVGSKVYKKTTGKSTDFSPTILLLSSIGIASGFGIHHHAGEEASGICYLCFGYATILAVVGLKLARANKVVRQNV
jgi:hypothetical protein